VRGVKRRPAAHLGIEKVAIDFVEHHERIEREDRYPHGGRKHLVERRAIDAVSITNERDRN
jgi:hypothetical protein